MFKKIKNILGFDKKNSIEIRPVFKNSSIKIKYFINDKEIEWDSLSTKEQNYYSKLLDKKYVKNKIPLEKFTPRVEAKNSIDGYSNVDPEWLLKALKDWEQCPESHPALEEWYESGCPDMPRKKTKAELEFEQYSPIFEQARELSKIDIKSAVEKYAYILENFKPAGTSYYTEPAYLFCRLCRYDEAMFCIGRAYENIFSFNKDMQRSLKDEFSEINEDINKQKEIFRRVLNAVKDNPGTIQSKIYKSIEVDSNRVRFVIKNMTDSGFLNREKHKNTYRLFATGKEMQHEYIIGF